MSDENRLGWLDLVWFLLILILADGTRTWYFWECLDPNLPGQPVLQAQDPFPPAESNGKAKLTGGATLSELDVLIANLGENPSRFASRAPLSSEEEYTAHVAPAYPWLLCQLNRLVGPEQFLSVLSWIQICLGAITAGLWLLFARLAFGNRLVAVLTGLLRAFHPFWIVNTPQVADGVLITFILAATMVLGTKASQNGGVIASFLYGILLACLGLIRATMLPFVFVALAWFLWRTRVFQRGWLCGLLAVLGFINGVPPWTIRNYQVFNDIVPIVDSAFVYLWMGNNPHSDDWRKSTNPPLTLPTDKNIRQTLSRERIDLLLKEKNQNLRYQMLAEDTLNYIRAHPAQTVERRLWAILQFYFGQRWFVSPHPEVNGDLEKISPPWVRNESTLIIQSTLLAMLLLALLGWRWSNAKHFTTGLSAIAFLWIPLPYILTQGEQLWGPRLPLDGVLLAYSALALIYFIPGLRGSLINPPNQENLGENLG